jgi:hypothetical protein
LSITEREQNRARVGGIKGWSSEASRLHQAPEGGVGWAQGRGHWRTGVGSSVPAASGLGMK